MNVALVARRFTEHGGTERFVVGLARHLLGQGHDVHIHCEQHRPDLAAHDWTLHPLKVWRPAKGLSLWNSTRGIDRSAHDVVMGFGKTIGHDVWRAGGGAHHAYLDACKPGWRANPAQWLERSLDHAAAGTAKRVVTPSQRAADDLTRCYGIPTQRISVIHNGVDSERFRPDIALRRWARNQLGLRGPILGFLGSGFRRKGLDVAIAVSEALGWPLVVLGTDTHLERWKRAHPTVHWLGSTETPEAWLPALDALVLPTRYEPYGNACLEAMACGVPAVTTSVNGVTEVFPVDLIGDTVDALATQCERAVQEGAALSRICRQAAVSLPRQAAFAAVEGLLMETAQ